MKHIILCLLFIACLAMSTIAQPSAAQIKKLFTIPGAVSVVVHKPGTREWSSTYKKYVWNLGFTVKRKTETPGILLIVKGYSTFDIVGGRYIYWRDFISSNSYEGIPNPTAADVQALIKKFGVKEFIGEQTYRFQLVGNVESIGLASEPNFEWHTPNFVSFNIVAIYTKKGNGNTAPNEHGEQTFLIRLYRDDTKADWNRIISSWKKWKAL